jgi:hypothetical protein
MSGDLLLQAGFPVVREANGNLVADVGMITGRKNVPQTNVHCRGGATSPSFAGAAREIKSPSSRV